LALVPIKFQNLLLKLWIHLDILVGLLELGIGPYQGLYLHKTLQHRNTWTYIHASKGIRTYDRNVRAVRNYTRFRPHDHWDRNSVDLLHAAVDLMELSSVGFD